MQRKRAKKKKISRHALLIGSTLVMVVGVTFAASSFAATGFQRNKVQSEIEKLLEENTNLEVQVTNLKSLHRLRESVSTQQNLVPVKDLQHIIFTKVPAQGSVGQK